MRSLPNSSIRGAVIEQAKGMLMFAYSISTDRAFDILTWRSQQTNTQLRVVTEYLVAAVATTTLLPDAGAQPFRPPTAHRAPPHHG
jgi:hypothetical protein